MHIFLRIRLFYVVWRGDLSLTTADATLVWAGFAPATTRMQVPSSITVPRAPAQTCCLIGCILANKRIYHFQLMFCGFCSDRLMYFHCWKLLNFKVGVITHSFVCADEKEWRLRRWMYCVLLCVHGWLITHSTMQIGTKNWGSFFLYLEFILFYAVLGEELSPCELFTTADATSVWAEFEPGSTCMVVPSCPRLLMPWKDFRQNLISFRLTDCAHHGEYCMTNRLCLMLQWTI